jgi:GNAT superfamily N-acetyltransferase
MAPSSAPALVFRNALARDFLPVTTILAAAFVESPVACWLDPNDQRRRLTLLAYIGDLVRRTIGTGGARVVEDGGEIVGAALWSVHSGAGQSVAARLAGRATERALTEVHRRRRELDRLVDDRRPRDVACQQLVCLGVRPDRQGQGIGNSLLIGHHAFLHVTNTPAYLVASADRPQTWFERYGYSGIGPTQLLPGGLPVQAMWRPPGPADPC